MTALLSYLVPPGAAPARVPARGRRGGRPCAARIEAPAQDVADRARGLEAGCGARSRSRPPGAGGPRAAQQRGGSVAGAREDSSRAYSLQSCGGAADRRRRPRHRLRAGPARALAGSQHQDGGATGSAYPWRGRSAMRTVARSTFGAGTGAVPERPFSCRSPRPPTGREGPSSVRPPPRLHEPPAHAAAGPVPIEARMENSVFRGTRRAGTHRGHGPRRRRRGSVRPRRRQEARPQRRGQHAGGGFLPRPAPRLPADGPTWCCSTCGCPTGRASTSCASFAPATTPMCRCWC